MLGKFIERVKSIFPQKAPAGPVVDNLAVLKKRSDRWGRIADVAAYVFVGAAAYFVFLAVVTPSIPMIALSLGLIAVTSPVFGIPAGRAERAAGAYGAALRQQTPVSAAPDTAAPAATVAATPAASPAFDQVAKPAEATAETSAEADTKPAPPAPKK